VSASIGSRVVKVGSMNAAWCQNRRGQADRVTDADRGEGVELVLGDHRTRIATCSAAGAQGRTAMSRTQQTAKQPPAAQSPATQSPIALACRQLRPALVAAMTGALCVEMHLYQNW
jgi:hypothetical protein